MCLFFSSFLTCNPSSSQTSVLPRSLLFPLPLVLAGLGPLLCWGAWASFRLRTVFLLCLLHPSPLSFVQFPNLVYHLGFLADCLNSFFISTLGNYKFIFFKFYSSNSAIIRLFKLQVYSMFCTSSRLFHNSVFQIFRKVMINIQYFCNITMMKNINILLISPSLYPELYQTWSRRNELYI